MPETSPFRLEAFDGAAGFHQLKPRWKELTASMNERGFYHCAEWYEAIVECLDDAPESFCFYCVFDGGHLAAVFPFKKRARRFLGIRFRSLELANHDHIPLADIVLPETERGPAIWRFFLEHLKQHAGNSWDFIRLPRVPENSGAVTVLAEKTGFKTLINYMHRCLYCPCCTAEDLSRNLSRSFRKSLRNAQNRLLRIGDASFFIAQSAPEQEQVFQDFLKLEASGWKARTGTAIAQDARLTGFYRRLIETFGPEKCVLDKLSVGNTAIAANFNLMTNETLYGLKTGIDDEHRPCSPGHLLMEKELTGAGIFPERLTVLNFVGDASWTLHWKPESMGVYDAYIFNTTFKAVVVFVRVALTHQLRLLYRRTLKSLIKRLKKAPNKNLKT